MTTIIVNENQTLTNAQNSGCLLIEVTELLDYGPELSASEVNGMKV